MQAGQQAQERSAGGAVNQLGQAAQEPAAQAADLPPIAAAPPEVRLLTGSCGRQLQTEKRLCSI